MKEYLVKKPFNYSPNGIEIVSLGEGEVVRMVSNPGLIDAGFVSEVETKQISAAPENKTFDGVPDDYKNLPAKDLVTLAKSIAPLSEVKKKSEALTAIETFLSRS